MANKKTIIEESNTNNSNSINMNELMSMISNLTEQINSMKTVNEELKKDNDNLKESLKNRENIVDSNTVSNNNNNNEFEYNPDKLISLRNMYDGLELNLKIDDNGNKFSIKKFGSTFKKRVLEVENLVRLNPKFAEKGYFIIEDREILEYVFPDLLECYKRTIDFKTINQIQKLSLNQLEEMYNNSNEQYRNTIIDKFISEWIRGEDIDFRDQNKINLLTKLSGVDVLALINGINECENLNNAMLAN